MFRDLHLDDDTQVEFARRLGEPETFGHGERPEIFVVTLDPAKSRSADYLRGTFRLAHRRHDRGHPDHGDSDAERATVKASGGRRSSRARTPRSRRSTPTSGRGSTPCGSSTRSRPEPARLARPDRRAS